MLRKALIDSFQNNYNKTLFIDKNDKYSYGSFFDLVTKLSFYFSQFTREFFNIKITNKIHFFATYLSIVFTDNVAVFCDEEKNIDVLEIIDDAKYSSIISTYKNGLNSYKKIDEDLVSTIIFTSGTTKQKRGVMLSNDNLYYSLTGGMSILSPSDELTFLSVLPITHIFGLTSDFLLPILSKSTVYVNNDNESLFKDIIEYKPTSINVTPLLLEKIMFYFEKNNNKILYNFNRFLVGGASVSKEIVKKVLSYNIDLYNGYGSTETSGCIGIAKIIDAECINYFTIIDNSKVSIDNNERICITGKNVMKGYYPDFSLTPYFVSNDLGSLIDEKRLLLKGRKDSLIVLPSGFKLYPEKVEAAVNSIEGVRGSLVYLFNNKCILKIDSNNKIDSEQLSKIPFITNIDEIVYGNLEYTDTNKTKRNQMDDLVFSEIKNIFKNYSKGDVLLTSNLKYDLSLSSLDLFMIFTEIENKFNKKFSSKEIKEMNTIQDVVLAVLNKKIKFVIGLPFVSDYDEWECFLDEYKKYIECIYFSIPLGKQYHSRESVNNFLKRPENVDKYYNLLHIALEKNIKLELVLNTYRLEESDIINAKQELELKNITIDSITIMDCHYDLIKKYFENVKINYSFNNYLNDKGDLKNRNYDGVIIGRYQIRNLSLINHIKNELKMKPIILLNNGCNHFCGWCHETIHCGKAFMDIKDKYPIEYLYALFSIMPNELEKYINIGIDTFKISSRNGDLTYLKKTIDSYINIREKEYIDKDINNYLLWSRLRWFLNYFKTFNYDRIIEYKNEIWKHEMVDYSSLQYKNDLMTNKGIIIDLSDKYSVLDVPIEKFHDLNLKLLRPFKTHIKGVIYGSSTCSKFIDAINVNKIIEKYKIAKEKGLETYFITPNVKEEYFEKYKQLIEVLIDNNLLDYLIANDYGIIELFHNRVPIILGRLFDKRNRDFRVNISYSCDELGVISEEYLNYYKEHKIKGITVEQLGNEKYSSIEMIKKIYINFPYIIESCGNICELSGISKEYSNKFKNDKCNFDCLKYSAYTKYDQTTVYKYMNSIYYSISLNESIINYFSNDKNEIIIKYFEV